MCIIRCETSLTMQSGEAGQKRRRIPAEAVLCRPLTNPAVLMDNLLHQPGPETMLMDVWMDGWRLSQS